MAFPARRKAIFVHGCFWHSHDCTHGRRRPNSNVAYWNEKSRANQARDSRKESALKALGWKVLVIWECEVRPTAGWSGRDASWVLGRQESDHACQNE
ncbi:MAG: hypothetical protein IPH55_06545 [Betaproteobacteria bacterium]|nr:hypothetical protein [Betaproteobacteria bacterium]